MLRKSADPQIHDRFRLARNLLKTVALAFLNLASPVRLDAISTNVDRAWQERGRERRTPRRLAKIRSDLSILRRRRAQPADGGVFRGYHFLSLCLNVLMPEANDLDRSSQASSRYARGAAAMDENKVAGSINEVKGAAKEAPVGEARLQSDGGA